MATKINRRNIDNQTLIDLGYTSSDTFTQVKFPLGDYGSVAQEIFGGLGLEQYGRIWDNKTTISVFYPDSLNPLDAGYLT